MKSSIIVHSGPEAYASITIWPAVAISSQLFHLRRLIHTLPLSGWGILALYLAAIMLLHGLYIYQRRLILTPRALRYRNLLFGWSLRREEIRATLTKHGEIGDHILIYSRDSKHPYTLPESLFRADATISWFRTLPVGQLLPEITMVRQERGNTVAHTKRALHIARIGIVITLLFAAFAPAGIFGTLGLCLPLFLLSCRVIPWSDRIYLFRPAVPEGRWYTALYLHLTLMGLLVCAGGRRMGLEMPDGFTLQMGLLCGALLFFLIHGPVRGRGSRVPGDYAPWGCILLPLIAYAGYGAITACLMTRFF